ncbi:MAG: hypothetical protein IJX11_03585 [Bacteroidales bacterium]|nr:hypothetical protein [Bacteroidales bacterium]
MNFKTIDDLKAAGFEGFVSVAGLWGGAASEIPSGKGVYMVVRQTAAAPVFLEVGTGGYFKKRNPNVPVGKLAANWVDETCIIYIGKATSLYKRLGQYLQFGQGKPVGHWGGRMIWQLADAEDLMFCWKELTGDSDPEYEETALIADFKCQYMGRRPFANLVK